MVYRPSNTTLCAGSTMPHITSTGRGGGVTGVAGARAHSEAGMAWAQREAQVLGDQDADPPWEAGGGARNVGFGASGTLQ